MPSLTPFRIRERIRSFFSLNIDEILDESKRMLEKDIKREFQLIEIPQAEVGEVTPPPIPKVINSRQFPQKELVFSLTELLPEILEESKKYGSVVQIFVALTLLETVEETEAKFFFLEEQAQGIEPIILLWAQAYQNKNYMLPPLTATVHWGFTPIIW